MAKAKKLKSGSWRVQVFSHYEEKDGKNTQKMQKIREMEILLRREDMLCNC